ncbi:MAG: hypothetical protein QOE33_826 [Acidobacteriota bacterium]|nr:hypothetical protein [Acidobacteriota bacterium]
MKYLFLLAVFALVAFMFYWRLRPYIATARRVLGFVRSARNLSTDDPSVAATRRASRAGEKLLRCETCGTWLPTSRALTHRGSAHVYCSRACLERAADPQRAKKVAGHS